VDGHERAKDYLTPGEVKALLDAAKAGRHGERDHLLLLMMFRHGLRVSEATSLRRDELDLDRARLWVRRLKGGLSVEQPIPGDELRAVRRHLAVRQGELPWLFLSERGQPLTRQAVNYLVAAAAERAGLQGAHPHTLRHSCGFCLADKGAELDHGKHSCGILTHRPVHEGLDSCTPRLPPLTSWKHSPSPCQSWRGLVQTTTWLGWPGFDLKHR